MGTGGGGVHFDPLIGEKGTELESTQGSKGMMVVRKQEAMKMPLVDGRHTLYTVLCMTMPHRSYLYIR
jgi:hypothetical protein